MKRLPNGNIELDLILTWKEISEQYEKLVLEAVANAELPGFRKGKAPRSAVEQNLNKNDLYSHAAQDLLPKLYEKALKTHKITPILYPQISLKKAKENEDWEFVAVVCEAPEIELPSEYKAKGLEYLDKSTTALIPEILAQEEANHRLSLLSENITKLGLTTEQYLQSKKTNAEGLRATALEEAKRDLKMEFVLEKIKTVHKLENRAKTLEYLNNLV